MEFWIIDNGERRGPFPDYTLREMIRAGTIKKATKVWHEGSDGWTEACEVGILKREFKTSEQALVEDEVIPPAIPLKVDWGMMWIRLGARWFDASLALLLFFCVTRIAEISLKMESGDQMSGWLVLLLFAPALIIEAILIHLFAKTPGKWLMGLHVETREGSRLPVGASVIRAMRVWVLGLGMMAGLLALIGHVFALWTVKRNGAPLWDLMTGHRVLGSHPSALRLVLYFGAFVVIWAMIFGVIWPDLEPEIEAAFEEAASQTLK